MKVLIFGGGGMLGHKLAQVLREAHDIGITFRSGFKEYEKFEIYDRLRIYENVRAEDSAAVEAVITNFRPQVIINAVGIIKQLPSAKNAVKTLEINSVFPHRLAELGEKYQTRLITVSTDCVFDGARGGYTEEDHPNARDLYGKSKELGEVVEGDSLTLRTSIIGRELRTAHSLVEWFLSNEGKSVKGYTKAIYSGFPTLVFAEIINRLIVEYPHLKGLYQVSSAPINKYELLGLIRDAYGSDIEIEPFNDFEIDRSLNSTKFQKACRIEIPEWRTMIERMAEDNRIYQK